MLKTKRISVLLLDDSADLVQLYKKQIEMVKKFVVTPEIDGHRARTIAEKQLFDLIVIDAKLDYRGIEFGGLRLADDLKLRYGANSILIISRYITQAMMQEYESYHEFMAKPSGSQGQQFIKELRSKLEQMQQRQYVFVAMPFSKDKSHIYINSIKPAVEEIGLQCIRVDEVPHTRGIQEKIFELIGKCKFVIFLADGGNPNAYYEAGFADAMSKEVIIIARTLDELKFDVSNRNTILYEGDLDLLKSKLKDKLFQLRISSPIGF